MLMTTQSAQEENSPDGLVSPARRFVMFGGGLGERQLERLEEQLRASRRDGQRCIVFCHQPVSCRWRVGAVARQQVHEVAVKLMEHGVTTCRLAGGAA